MLEEIEGESVLWKYQLPSGGLFNRSKPNIFYVLTASRAIVVGAIGNDITIIEQCQLDNVFPSVMDVTTESSKSVSAIFKRIKGEETPFTKFALREYGSILFFEKGVVKLRFDYVEDPNDVINLIDVIKKQRVKSSVSNSKITTGENEVEIWNSGTLLSRIQFVESKRTEHNIKIRYVITNKRAYIIGNSGEEKIEKGLNGWPVSGLLVVPENWNGGIIAECNLLEVEPVILRRRKWEGPPIETYDPWSKESREFGDIVFVGRDKILLTFKDVQNPDDVIKLIRDTLSSDMA
jgi:hypothetical protein